MKVFVACNFLHNSRKTGFTLLHGPHQVAVKKISARSFM
jgi:hypothetical protein